jgi:hypothetical protein
MKLTDVATGQELTPELIALIELSAVHPQISVDVCPEITLVSWRVAEVTVPYDKQRTHHMIGYNVETGSGAVSSAIQKTETKDGKVFCTTESGRVYELKGIPGRNSDAEYVWGRWVGINGATDVVDVSGQYTGG